MTPEDAWTDICDEVRKTKDLYLGELEACEDIIVEAIRQVIAAEREACAQYLDSYAIRYRATGNPTGLYQAQMFDDIAEAIRARGK